MKRKKDDFGKKRHQVINNAISIAYIFIIIMIILLLSMDISSATPPSTAKGAHSSSGASTSRATWYLADGYTGWQNYIAIRSVSEYRQTVDLYFYGESDTNSYLGHTAISLEPSRRGTVYVNGVIGNNLNYSCTIYGQFNIVAERSMYVGNEGTCGSGSGYLVFQSASNPWWCFGDVYSDSTATSYIEVYNADLYSGATHYVETYNGTSGDNQVETRSMYIKPRTRKTFTYTSSGAKNRVAIVRSESSNAFMAERSYVKGTMATSNGGTWRKENDCVYFAEGYSNYPTWYVTGFSDRYTGRFGSYLQVNSQNSWNGGSVSRNNWIYTGTSLSTAVSGLPGGVNYGTTIDRLSWSQNPNRPWYYNTERTTQFNSWATSSEGRNGYDVAARDFFFSECYTGHDVYLTFYNASAYPNVTFHVWVTSDTADNWSFDITISRAGSVRLQDCGVPWNRNCSIHVKPLNDRWPVAVERSSYFN